MGDLQASTSTKISEARAKLASQALKKSPKPQVGVVTVESDAPLPQQPPSGFVDLSETLTPEPEPSRAESPFNSGKSPGTFKNRSDPGADFGAARFAEQGDVQSGRENGQSRGQGGGNSRERKEGGKERRKCSC